MIFIWLKNALLI